jgi:hypothetical protein
MGAYDAIFSGRSTFAVEMDEVSCWVANNLLSGDWPVSVSSQAKKILTEAGPKAMTILDGEFRLDQHHA